MITLDRKEASRIWEEYWHGMCQEWFKIEVLQDYVGQDDCPSLRAWLEGDTQTSLKMLPHDTAPWAKQLLQKHQQGVLMRRIRIVQKPYTPYTEWEFACYKRNNIPSGEQVFVVDKAVVEGLDLPQGDLMMFDNKRIAICTYDQTGRVIRQTFYGENDDITKFLQLKHDLLSIAQPIRA